MGHGKFRVALPPAPSPSQMLRVRAQQKPAHLNIWPFLLIPSFTKGLLKTIKVPPQANKAMTNKWLFNTKRVVWGPQKGNV